MKSWHGHIRAHIELWKAALPADRAWWPSYVYHFTDVQNAASILRSGCLYSRERALKLGLMKNDNASSVVIGETPAARLELVRLYFRPRTPTQFRNEGIKPPADRYHGSHCPVPVFFCFDAFELLSRDDVRVSNGNMGKPGTLCDDSLALFQSIRFEDVFHHGAWPSADADRIKNARHCEVLVRDELSLPPRPMVVCRSLAERQTLIHLLPSDQRTRWDAHVRVNPTFFERRGTYIETVNVVGRDVVQIDFHLGVGGTDMTTRFVLTNGKNNFRWSGKLSGASESFRVRDVLRGVAHVEIDDCLAFAGGLVFDDIPF